MQVENAVNSGAALVTVALSMTLLIMVGDRASTPGNYNFASVWHPIIMTLAFGFCMTNALISYRTDLCGLLSTRGSRRGIHGLLNLLALVFALVGVALMYSSEGGIKLTDSLWPVGGSNAAKAHVAIGWIALIGVLLTSMFGILKLAIKSTGANDNAALPGAFLHGYVGQAVWFLGMTNICIGASEQLWGLQNRKGVYAICAILMATVLAMIYVVPTQVRGDKSSKEEPGQAVLNPGTSLLPPGKGA